MRLRAIIWIGIALLIGAALGCGAPRRNALTIKGSDTMVLLGQRWAEAFMDGHPGEVVQVTGGGSGTGIAALLNGTTEICQSSRPLKPAERRDLQARSGEPPHELAVARDGLSIYVNDGNAVRALTIAQVRGIYDGALANWKDVGGADAPIVCYGRESGSGTYAYFKEHVLGGADFAVSVQSLPGTAAVVNAVAKDPRGIGYGGAAYAKGVRDLGVRRDDRSDPVLPTAGNVRSGAYPISRDLFFYLRREPQGSARAFVDFVLSAAGQAVVHDVGYFPVR